MGISLPPSRRTSTKSVLCDKPTVLPKNLPTLAVLLSCCLQVRTKGTLNVVVSDVLDMMCL